MTNKKTMLPHKFGHVQLRVSHETQTGAAHFCAKKKNPEGFRHSSIFLCVPIHKRLELVPACSSFRSFVLVFPNKTSKNSRLRSANETPHYKFLAFRHPSAYIRPISPSV